MAFNVSSCLFLCILITVGVTVPSSCAAQETDGYAALMHDAHGLAEQYRGLEPGSEQAKGVQEQLRSTLAQAFQSRQTQQRAELKTLREQLDSAEQLVNQREKLRDRIIERKLEDMLQGASADWPENGLGDLDEQLAFDVIQAGDTVAVFIDSILPPHGPQQRQSTPPITALPSGRVVSGFPFVVAADGTLQLPYIAPVKIAGLSVREAESRIDKAYVEKAILQPGRFTAILTLVPRETADAGQKGPSD